MFSTLHATTIAEAALILLAVVILVISAARVRLAWFGPSESTRTNGTYFLAVMISAIAFWAIALTLFSTAEEGRVERNVLMISTLLAMYAPGFTGGWRSAIPPATYDYAVARADRSDSYLNSLFLLVLALAALILGAAGILRGL